MTDSANEMTPQEKVIEERVAQARKFLTFPYITSESRSTNSKLPHYPVYRLETIDLIFPICYSSLVINKRVLY